MIGSGTATTTMVATEAGTAAAAMVAVGACTEVVAVAVGAVAVGAGPGLELSAGGGEDCRTLGRKLCPPRVFIMAWLEKEKRWRGWEKKRFHKCFGMKMREGRGGGGGGGGGV